MSSYIGILDIRNAEEIKEIFRIVDSLAEKFCTPPQTLDRHIMIGALANSRTFSKRNNIDKMFHGAHRTIGLFLIHYQAKYSRQNLYEQMRRLENAGGDCLNGLQLNIPWPNIAGLAQHRSSYDLEDKIIEIILQIGPHALSMVNQSPDLLAKRIKPYERYIDHILLDSTDKTGNLIAPEKIADYLSAIASNCQTLGIGVTDKLNPDSLSLLKLLLQKFPRLNFQAGPFPRTNGELDFNQIKDYLEKSFWLLLDNS